MRFDGRANRVADDLRRIALSDECVRADRECLRRHLPGRTDCDDDRGCAESPGRCDFAQPRGCIAIEIDQYCVWAATANRAFEFTAVDFLDDLDPSIRNQQPCQGAAHPSILPNHDSADRMAWIEKHGCQGRGRAARSRLSHVLTADRSMSPDHCDKCGRSAIG
jgi:hypothetical protein